MTSKESNLDKNCLMDESTTTIKGSSS